MSAGELPVLCALLFPLPLSVSPVIRDFAHGYYQRPGRSSWVPEAGWVRCWSAQILGWAVSEPFKSNLDVFAVQDVVLGTLSS